MAIVLFSNALTSEESKQTDGNGSSDKTPVCTICHQKRGRYKFEPQPEKDRKERYLRVHQGTWEGFRTPSQCHGRKVRGVAPGDHSRKHFHERSAEPRIPRDDKKGRVAERGRTVAKGKGGCWSGGDPSTATLFTSNCPFL
jgi:hypothetical protein